MTKYILSDFLLLSTSDLVIKGRNDEVNEVSLNVNRVSGFRYDTKPEEIYNSV